MEQFVQHHEKASLSASNRVHFSYDDVAGRCSFSDKGEEQFYYDSWWRKCRLKEIEEKTGWFENSVK